MTIYAWIIRDIRLRGQGGSYFIVLGDDYLDSGLGSIVLTAL